MNPPSVSQVVNQNPLQSGTPVTAPVAIGNYQNVNSGVKTEVFSMGGAGALTINSKDGVVTGAARQINKSGVSYN